VFKSIQSRILLSYFVVILISLLLTGFLFYQFLIFYTLRAKKIELRRQAEITAEIVERSWEGGNFSISQRALLLEEKLLKVKIFLVPFLERKAERRFPLNWEKLRSGQTQTLEKKLPQSGRAIVVAVPLERNGKFFGALVLVTTFRELALTQLPFLYILLLSILLSFFISLGIGSYLSLRISTPLKELKEKALEMAKGNFEAEVEVTSGDEIGLLARAFNYLGKSLKQMYEVHRNLLANVSHELKIPLTSIEGYAQALLEGVVKDETKRRKSLEIIREEAKRLSRLVSQLLTLSALDAKKLKLNLQAVKLKDILGKLSERYKEEALRKGLTFSISIRGEEKVFADPDRLEQVLTNLLDNAFKSTEKGRVSLSVEKRGREVAIEVGDTGAGIPKEDLPHIFERFYRVERSRSRKSGGTGLGLAIAREIVEAFGGRIEVKSKLGEGTTFIITLPSA
jgi:signal transduction histidine kinase